MAQSSRAAGPRRTPRRGPRAARTAPTAKRKPAASAVRKPAAAAKRKPAPSTERKQAAAAKRKPTGSATRTAAARTPAATRRPATRRSSARPARPVGRVRRAARFGRNRLYLFGTGVLVVLLGVMASGPYADYSAAQERVDSLEQQQSALDEAVTALEAEAQRLQDPSSLEEQARSQLGLVRPGEIPYIVVNPPTTAPVPVNANPDLTTGEDASPSLLDRAIDWITALAS